MLSPFPQAREEIRFSSLRMETACAVQNHIRQNKTKLCFPANGAILISVCWKKDDWWLSALVSHVHRLQQVVKEEQEMTLRRSQQLLLERKAASVFRIFNGGCNLIKLLLISAASLLVSIMRSGIRQRESIVFSFQEKIYIFKFYPTAVNPRVIILLSQY